MKVIIAGGSGFIGRALCVELARARDEVIVLSRFLPGKISVAKSVQYHTWEPQVQGGEWEKILEGADALINLCGANIVQKRWTKDRKKIILSSRTDTTRALVTAISRRKDKPKVFINASAVGFYGPRGDGAIDESVGAGYGFLANVCQAWESQALKAKDFGLRVIRLRIGIVLGKEGGALKKMLLPFQLGLGSLLGDGFQWMSWIAKEDLTALIHYLLNSNIKGSVNATAPHPVTNREFTTQLAYALKRPALFKVPAWALRFFLGEAAEMLLTGQRVMPRVLLDSGFNFKYPTLPAWLEANFKTKNVK